MKKSLLVVFSLLLGSLLYAQDNFPINDVRDNRSDAYAFTNATIHVNHNTTLTNATLLIKEGKVYQVGTNLTVPKGYTVIESEGKHIYPSFIEVYGNYGLPKPDKSGGFSWSAAEKIAPQKKGAYNANDAIRSHYNAAEEFKIDDDAAKELRNLGFGTVSSFMKDGIARGSSVLVTLAENSDNEVMLKSKSAAHYSLDRGSSTQYYPVSMMGSIALLRQTYLDAEWYKSTQPFSDITLDNWIAQQSLPQIFEVGDKLTALQIDKLGDEFGVQYIIKGNGDEYQRISNIKGTNAPFIIPVDFPDAYDVSDPLDAMDVSLADMKHWELAPTNPAVLEKNNVRFAFTASDLKKKSDLLPNIRKAIENGLSEETALEALTSTPASLLKVQNQLGSLDKGKLANFIITSDNIFEEKTKIYDNWVQGIRYAVNQESEEIKTGVYNMNLGKDNFIVHIDGEPGSYNFKIVINDSTNIKMKSKIVDDMINLSYTPQDEEKDIRINGWKIDNGWSGKAQMLDGSWNTWGLTYSSDLEKKESEEKKEGEGDEESEESSIGSVIYPFVAYGNEMLPVQESILITNTTVWTNEDEGVIENTDVLLQNGKIAKIGKGLSANGAKSIDGSGKHLTAGIIDEHSHIALKSVNDVAVNSSMVRMKDVVDSEDINIYRQLSGGVTTSQLLHGSANPIGGQSAIIKLRWGASPEEMLVNGADPFIKFALGENVKRSWSNNSIRYPQTRMGVEQVYEDAFTNALNYEKQWKAYNALSSKEKAKAAKPRKDLVHEAMLEILKGKRFITCHSYVQSEINMLMKVAEKYNFRVNTFTHILEGYKVADKMAKHGVGGSTFADWWAYKWEVRYAIPYNASLMHNEGVTVAINSDDAEMGRRLNQEAAKSVKYGGMSEEDALKMVTLNPAKLLHLDDRMGSIKIGKDADVVLWSDHPLSIYAKAEKTIIDGKVYYDIEKDNEMREWIQKERVRLMDKMTDEKNGGGKTQKPKKKGSHNFHCDDVVETQTIILNR